ncbi:MAG: ribosome small subunit-dependent GTPase A [Firmicutes bacterium]|uniref:Small ribosomal subunit biogenesis GTPase RsgA n=1 Tax=Melghirimyces thermohalophilus TaxID=1236220 RepID=A0A1G6NIQ8_9BACL|nr:ribosome small subunit-dependent GTPase A [Melghirimyces thermohalophilus]MDA8353702.1 ribosome small subunit-dependent GTPase A [Bacillota bacterium]SDC67005.1 ribosome biogenesis GTPase [Melghirimyces thermohalophilus]
MPEGQIVRALSGFFYVRTPHRDIRCRARGVFKKKKWSPLVGDWVTYEETDATEGWVTHLHPRKTELVRPPIANVDQAVVIGSFLEPKVQSELLDRFLVHAERAGLETVICLTKSDLLPDSSEEKALREIYEAADYPVLITSVHTGEGIEELKRALKNRLSVFAGQSGVGKSSLLNAILPSARLQTGEVSRKLGRGRHTTRHVEILDLPGGGQVADTPGFSQLSFGKMEATELGRCFPELAERASDCKFRGCLHKNEPGCAVREALTTGEISGTRYRHYLQFLEEINEQRRY